MLAARLAEGIAMLRLSLSAAQQNRLLSYLNKLAKWNEVYNLTAVRNPAEMVTRHLLDSLAVLPYVQGTRILDVGSGAGLPGIPLAIALPDRQFVLLDSVAKKTRFMVQMVGELELANVTVENRRVEDFHPPAPFDTVISRAFSRIAEFIIAAGPLCRPGGILLAMKGRYPHDELNDLPAAFHLREVVRLEVPGLAEERHLACLEHNPVNQQLSDG